MWLDKDYPMHGGKRMLVYTKSSGYEHPIVYRDTAWPSALESELLNLGQEQRVDFVFTKDGTMFTPENLAAFDAILFYTSGDPCVQERNGLGDNYPLMPRAGMVALFEAIRSGKGFIGIHSTLDDALAPLLGAHDAGEGPLERRSLRIRDSAFPGMDLLPADFAPLEESRVFKNLRPDLHLLLAADDTKPLAWARMEGKGRVYYSVLGHSEETWKTPAFRKMLFGAIQWATRDAGTDIIPAKIGHETMILRSILRIAATLCASLASVHAAEPKPAKPIPEYPAPPGAMPSRPINIDVGRQLFVDDWLIAETTLKRTFHQAKVQDGSGAESRDGSRNEAGHGRRRSALRWRRLVRSEG